MLALRALTAAIDAAHEMVCRWMGAGKRIVGHVARAALVFHDLRRVHDA